MNEPNNDAIATVAKSGVDALMTTSAKLLKSKVEERSTAITVHDRLRLEVLDKHRIAMERLHAETAEELRRLAGEHEDYLRGVNHVIAKLQAMRDA